MTVLPRTLAAVLVAALALVACGDDDSAAPEVSLTPAGEAGRQLARDKGCAACHGTTGEGNVGPAFVGLYGSEVALQDGSTVVADDAYLRQSMLDPNSQKVEGYNVPMPKPDLSDAEIDSLLTYIRELGG
jgi:cytochrome c oxidase subunit 2